MKKVLFESEIKIEDFSLPWSVYPLANLKKYGLSADVFAVYIADGKIVTKHDDTIQICSDELTKNACLEIADFIRQNRIRMISGRKDNLEKLMPLLSNAKLVSGYIFELESFDVDSVFVVEKAEDNHFKDIAELVCEVNSTNKSYYKLEQYFNQIYERHKDGYCHNWIIHHDNKIIGHIATYAEADNYAVLGGLAVDADYRGKGIAKALLSYSIASIREAGKKCYAYCYNENLVGFYKKHCSHEFVCSKILIDTSK